MYEIAYPRPPTTRNRHATYTAIALRLMVFMCESMTTNLADGVSITTPREHPYYCDVASEDLVALSFCLRYLDL
jgi:hypothetical protein